jgi:glutamyl-tRNA synthetase
MSSVVTRFAPSPTGYFHAGSYRTALFAWLFARQNQGKFILRIEDTDKERSKKEYEENIVDSLKWLGLNYDEFYRQSDRTEIYKKYIQQLIDSGHAYISKEAAPDGDPEGKRRGEVIRFKNPNTKVRFNDLIRGPIEFDTTELGDFVIAKSFEEPVFHLVVVIDDHDMGVTHVVRGEDHISNTPRQILIYNALNAPLPQYAHIPLLLASDRSKLSKRNGAVAVTEYRNRGYLPEAVVNYLALLGWHPTDDREVLTTEELIKEFSLDRIQKGGAIFDEEKLAWFNRQYMVKLTDEAFTERATSFIPEWMTTHSTLFTRVLPVLRDKIGKFSDLSHMLSPHGDLGFIKAVPDYPKELLLWKKNPDAGAARTHLLKVRDLLSTMSDSNFTPDEIKNNLWAYAEAHGKGDVLWPLRVSITGREKSPDPFISASLVGREEALARIDKAAASLVSS